MDMKNSRAIVGLIRESTLQLLDRKQSAHNWIGDSRGWCSRSQATGATPKSIPTQVSFTPTVMSYPNSAKLEAKPGGTIGRTR